MARRAAIVAIVVGAVLSLLSLGGWARPVAAIDSVEAHML